MSFSSFHINVDNFGPPNSAALPVPTPTSIFSTLASTEAFSTQHPLSYKIPSNYGSRVGSFQHDLKSGYTLRWKNWQEMESWKLQEEEKNTVEFVRKEIKRNKDADPIWEEKHIYICARGWSGGKNKYHKKHTDRDRKVPQKRIGCQCRLTVKTYPGTSEVLGLYSSKHSHETGNKNTRFTRLRKETRQEIEQMLRLGIEPKKVLEHVQGKIYTEENLRNLQSDGAR